MRTKPNNHRSASDHSHWTHNDLYRRFRREFDLFLHGDTPCTDSNSWDECYVKNSNIEARLDYILDSGSDTIQFLIGRTGVGKSTLIRHKFRTGRKATIINDALIIPFSFDSMAININDYEMKLGAIINAASRFLYKKFHIEYSDERLVEFIEEHSPDVAVRGTTDITTSDSKLLDNLRKADEFSFTLEQFKYYFYSTSLSRVVLVVDDIESETQTIQEQVIESICRMYFCFRNQLNRKAKVNLLFSVRPVTEKLARKNKSINAYPFSRAIIIKKPIPLNELFRARMNYAISNIGTEHIKNIDSWNDALEILESIVQSVSDKFGFRLLGLFNNNIRRTLIEFQLLITNRQWLQRNQDPSPSFKIDMGDYALNQATVYRALAMRNGTVYPSEGTCLVNIFWNRPEPTYDLLVIYVILYMIERNNGNKYLDQVVEYTELTDSLSKVIAIDNYENVISRILEKMEESKLIDNEHVENANGEKKSYIALHPRAEEIWDLLKESSVPLELFRDDTYQDFRGRNRSLSTAMSAEDAFVENFNFLGQIISWEKRFIDTFRRNDPLYASRLFGGVVISEHLLLGIRKSIYAYYKDADEIPRQLKDRLTASFSRVNRLEYAR